MSWAYIKTLFLNILLCKMLVILLLILQQRSLYSTKYDQIRISDTSKFFAASHPQTQFFETFKNQLLGYRKQFPKDKG